VKKHPIIIDPKFRSLIPPMSADERAQLKENIRQHGLLSPLLLWAGAGIVDGQEPPDPLVLIDGHHRFEILQELAQEEPKWKEWNSVKLPIEFHFNFVYLTDREAVKLWILEHQVGRRNLTKEQRIEMVASIVLLRQEAAAKISRANLKQGNSAPDVTKTVPSGKRTVAAASKEFAVPRRPLQAAVNKAKGKPAAPPQKKQRRKLHVSLDDIDVDFMKKFMEEIRRSKQYPRQAMKFQGVPEAVLKEAEEVVNDGLRARALKKHPDHGGSQEEMQLLNAAVSWLRLVVEKEKKPGREEHAA
jgi:hypothetical protein